MNPQFWCPLNLYAFRAYQPLISYKVSRANHEYGTFTHNKRAELCLPEHADIIIIIPPKHTPRTKRITKFLAVRTAISVTIFLAQGGRRAKSGVLEGTTYTSCIPWKPLGPLGLRSVSIGVCFGRSLPGEIQPSSHLHIGHTICLWCLHLPKYKCNKVCRAAKTTIV